MDKTILNKLKNVRITNMNLVRYIQTNKIELDNLDIDKCIDLIEISEPTLTREVLENLVNEDIQNMTLIIEAVTSNISAGEEKKTIKKPQPKRVSK